MKHTLRMFSLLVTACLLLTACLGDDDDTQVAYTGDMAITAFTLGTIPRYTTGTTSAGNDTLLRTTITGTVYPMTIDQLGARIYNEEPLPVGTDVKHVVCTVSTKNGGSVALQSMTSDSLSWFNSSDSIDFSRPRVFRIFAIDGSGHRDYTVTLNVSDTKGTTFDWKRVATDVVDVPASQCASLRLLNVADRLVMLPLTWSADDDVSDSARRVMVSDDGQQWTTLLTLPDQQWQGAVAHDDALYLKTGATLQKLGGNAGWTDGWSTVATDCPAGQLVGASTTELFMLGADGRLMRSADAGLTWQEELLDDEASLLPAENVATVTWPYAAADNTDYVLMVGNSQQNADQMTTWRKISEHGMAGQWVYMPVDDSNLSTLPRMENVSLAYYNNMVLAIGDGLVVYESADQGISWKVSKQYALPVALEGTRCAITAGADGTLWLVSNNGDVWRGQKY